MSDPRSTAPDGIAIIGMSGRFPGAPDLESYWTNLRDGVESVTSFTQDELLAGGLDRSVLEDPDYVRAGAVLEDVESFDAELFGYSPGEAELMDPQHRLFLECSWAALEHAGYAPRGRTERIGVFGGCGINGYLLHHVLADPDRLERVGPYQAVIGNDKDFLATRVSYKLGLEGPGLTVQTACSTSLVAICAACQSLLDGECDMALAGGVTVRIPHRVGYRYQAEGILSPDGHCRAFDAEARGTVPGSGVGIVALKPLYRALADGDRVHAVIRGWAVNNDGGRKVGFTAPSVEGQTIAVAEALAMAGLDPESIGYVETHGTGTRLGDPIEMAALARVFGGRNGSRPRPRPLAIGSVKTNVGHLDAAAGVAGLIKTVLALTHRELPPTLHFRSWNPEIAEARDSFRVVAERTPWDSDGSPRRAGVSSFGIGGTNAHVVVEEAPASGSLASPGLPGFELTHALFVLSGRTEEALARATTDLERGLQGAGEVQDVAYTLQTGRVAFPHRRALVVSDPPSANELRNITDVGRACSGVAGEAPPVGFLLTGQGAQRPGMGATLYRALPAFAEAMDRCASILGPHLGLDLRKAMFRDPTDEQAARDLEQTALAQPALFAFEYALARTYMELGVSPHAMLGHSVGEYVAACLSGALPLEDALRVIAARGRLMQGLPRGAMAAVSMAEAALAPLLPERVSLAAVNGPDLCTVSGPEDAVAALERVLAEANVISRRLHTSHAFHSSMMDPILDAFRAELEDVTWDHPRTPWVSNLTGTWITPEQAGSPEYWVRHLREPVRFADGLRTILERPDLVLLEAGPGPVLTGMARLEPRARGRAVIASSPHVQEGARELEAFLRAVGDLWIRGVPIRWEALHRDHRRCRVPLPTYPFERTRHWLEPAATPAVKRPRTLGKRPDPVEWLYRPTWKRAAPAPPAQDDGPSRWFVFEDEQGVGESISRALAARGANVVRVRAGGSFERSGPSEYRIAPDRAEDYEALLSSLQDTNGLPQEVVHLWSLADPAPSGSDPQRGFASLVLCVQALAPLARGARTRISVVTGEVQSVLGSEEIDPERATTLGLCRVIPQEYPHFPCRTIDVLMQDAASDHASFLVREITSASDDSEVALRGRHRWVPSYEPLRLSVSNEESPPALEAGAHVLIAGGLGRFGLALAAYLSRTASAKVTLLDRRLVPPRERWSSLAEGNGAEDAGTARALLDLEARQATFHALCVDIADPDALARAVHEAERRFGAVTAVVHAAGPADEVAYRPIQEITPDHWKDHFTSKLGGIRALETVFAGRPPAVALATSSLAPVLGGIGLAGMAATDRFLGALAERAPRPGRMPWRVIDWEGWEQRWADGALAVLGREQNELLLAWPEVEDVLDRVLRAAAFPRVTVSTADLEVRLERWTRVLESDGRPAARGSGASRGGRTPAEGTEASVAAVWCEALGLETIGADEDFFELGGNSLVGLQVLSRLRRMFDVELPLRIFFESRTVAAMAGAIESERAGSSDASARIAAILDEIESLSDEEIEAHLRSLPAGEGVGEDRA